MSAIIEGFALFSSGAVGGMVLMGLAARRPIRLADAAVATTSAKVVALIDDDSVLRRQELRSDRIILERNERMREILHGVCDTLGVDEFDQAERAAHHLARRCDELSRRPTTADHKAAKREIGRLKRMMDGPR